LSFSSHDLIIAVDDPRSEDVGELLETHLAFSYRVSPADHVHALEIKGLLESGVTFFSARRDGRLLGVGALKRIDDAHAEIKSMHTAEVARGRGVGRAMVNHLLAFAREHDYRRVSLETGAMEEYAAARSLYEGVGFRLCEPFGQYTVNRFSVCMTIELDEVHDIS
jgi:putative acetyltransferase